MLCRRNDVKAGGKTGPCWILPSKLDELHGLTIHRESPRRGFLPAAAVQFLAATQDVLADP